MPFTSLKLHPGANAEFTPALNEAGISSCNLIRFKSSLPQKMGGWQKFYPLNVSGVPRALHAWQDLTATKHLGVGTTTQLAIITSGDLNDVTPQTVTTDGSVDFSTVSGSPTVTIIDSNISNVTVYDVIFLNTPVAIGGLVLHGQYLISSIGGTHQYTIDAVANATNTVNNSGAVPSIATTANSATVTVTLNDHGLAVGDVFTFPIATTVGGVTVSGTYRITSVPSANAFTIVVNALATSSTSASMNSGQAEIVYYLNLGPTIVGSGYGVGGYGLGGYGTGQTTGSSQTGTTITPSNWSLDNWGDTLLACPRGGGIYAWSPVSGFSNAPLVGTAPIFNNGLFVAMPQRILVCWGSTSAYPRFPNALASAEEQDPLLVRWSDVLDYTNFTVDTTTQAGSFRIPSGSTIVGAIQGPQQAIIFTDIEAWAMQYLGYPLVFGFNKIGSGCGLIAQHAVAAMRGIVAWMGLGSFFMLSGSGVQEIPCSVWDVVFQDLDTANQDKIVCAANSQFSEFTWFYPSASGGGSGEPDKYVKVNISEGFVWDYGTLSRCAWIDQSVLGQALGAAPDGYIYQHESGFDDDDVTPLNSFFESGWFTIAEGSNFAFVDEFHPDMKWGLFGGSNNAQVLVTIYGADYPNGTVYTYGPYSITAAQTFVTTRLRHRLIKVRISSSDILGSFWRLGNMRSRIAQDGRR